MTAYFQSVGQHKRAWARVNDTRPRAEVQLIKQSDGTYYDISAGRGHIEVYDADNEYTLLSGNALNFSEGSNGTAYFEWQQGQLVSAGTYNIIFKIDPLSDGNYLSVPEEPYDYILRVVGFGSPKGYITPPYDDPMYYTKLEIDAFEYVTSGDTRLSNQRDASSIQGIGVSTTGPTNGQELTYNAATQEWEPATPSAGVSPSDTIISGTTWGQIPAVGLSALYSRGDHSHGTVPNIEYPNILYVGSNLFSGVTSFQSIAAAHTYMNSLPNPPALGNEFKLVLSSEDFYEDVPLMKFVSYEGESTRATINGNLTTGTIMVELGEAGVFKDITLAPQVDKAVGLAVPDCTMVEGIAVAGAVSGTLIVNGVDTNVANDETFTFTTESTTDEVVATILATTVNVYAKNRNGKLAIISKASDSLTIYSTGTANAALGFSIVSDTVETRSTNPTRFISNVSITGYGGLFINYTAKKLDTGLLYEDAGNGMIALGLSVSGANGTASGRGVAMERGGALLGNATITMCGVGLWLESDAYTSAAAPLIPVGLIKYNTIDIDSNFVTDVITVLTNTLTVGANITLNNNINIHGVGEFDNLIDSTFDATANNYHYHSDYSYQPYTYFIDVSGGDGIVNLIAATGNDGRRYEIKKTDASTHTLTVLPNGTDLIDGYATRVLTLQNEFLVIESDDTGWQIIASSDSDKIQGIAIDSALPADGNALMYSGVTGKWMPIAISPEAIGAEPVISAKGTAFNKDYGAAADTICSGDDSRLSDARTPTAHGSTHRLTDPEILYNFAVGGETDFYTVTSTVINAPWTGAPLGGGTATTVANATHPGVVQVASTATANSGYRWMLSANNGALFYLAGGESAEVIFGITTSTNITVNFGFVETSSSNVVPLDGAWISLIGTTLTGKTCNGSNSGNTSTTGTSYTISTATWYRAKLLVNSDASRVDFYLYTSANDTQVWTDFLTAHIPTANYIGHGLFVTVSSGAGQTIGIFDYMNFKILRALAR